MEKPDLLDGIDEMESRLVEAKGRALEAYRIANGAGPSLQGSTMKQARTYFIHLAILHRTQAAKK